MFLLEDILPAREAVASPLGPTTELLGFTDQSSRVRPGSLFFAIAGKSQDGHAFVAEALSKGAIGAVVEREVLDLSARDLSRVIQVTSTRRSLAMAWARAYANPSQNFKVVGVTGTNGKTTATFLLSQIWSRLGLKPGLIGTVETRVGDRIIPSNLTTPGPEELQGLFHQMAEAGVHAAAMEVSSIALDQHRTWGTAFEVAVFTNLTQDHLDYHGDFENYYEAKRLLFTEYGVRAAVINIDDPWGRRLVSEIAVSRVLTFGFSADADFCPVSYELGTEGTHARLKTTQGAFDLSTPLTGRHNLANCLAALAVCDAMGLELRYAAGALAESPGAAGRLERVPIASGPSVFVDYAHSPDALANVLVTLRELRRASGKIFTVFGCGGDRDRSKRPLMGEVASRLSDVTIVTSDNPRTEVPEKIIDEIETGILREKTRYLREQDRKRAICTALEQAGENDIVLIAGKGHETYQILGNEKFPFDDRKVVREYYG